MSKKRPMTQHQSARVDDANYRSNFPFQFHCDHKTKVINCFWFPFFAAEHLSSPKQDQFTITTVLRDFHSSSHAASSRRSSSRHLIPDRNHIRPLAMRVSPCSVNSRFPRTVLFQRLLHHLPRPPTPPHLDPCCRRVIPRARVFVLRDAAVFSASHNIYGLKMSR
jgi:hypothetical protein